MKTRLAYHSKDVHENGDIMEIKIWEVPASKDKPHGFKYSLAYIVKGKRVVGYDNGERKSDHRHILDKEFQYKFKGVGKLFKDFKKDIEKARKGKNHEG